MNVTGEACAAAAVRLGLPQLATCLHAGLQPSLPVAYGCTADGVAARNVCTLIVCIAVVKRLPQMRSAAAANYSSPIQQLLPVLPTTADVDDKIILRARRNHLLASYRDAARVRAAALWGGLPVC